MVDRRGQGPGCHPKQPGTGGPVSGTGRECDGYNGVNGVMKPGYRGFPILPGIVEIPVDGSSFTRHGFEYLKVGNVSRHSRGSAADAAITRSFLPPVTGPEIATAAAHQDAGLVDPSPDLEAHPAVAVPLGGDLVRPMNVHGNLTRLLADPQSHHRLHESPVLAPRPHRGLYRWLLAHGCRRPLEAAPTDGLSASLADAFPVEIPAGLVDLWTARQRIPQESFGREQLLGDDATVAAPDAA